MLVVSRQRDESIMVGDEIEITLIDIRGDKARIGIEAPADVPVHRREVYLSMKEATGKSPSSGLPSPPTEVPRDYGLAGAYAI